MKRDTLPQFADFDAFKEDIKKIGKTITQKVVVPQQYTATQHEFKKEKVLKIAKDNNYSNKPIVTTKDLYVIDGHHRWLACLVNGDPTIKTSEVNMNMKDLINFVKDKPYVEYKGV